ncbi:uncharacterized protein LOC133292064 [Gastrolobium bilobum]|uniref:uncharacterized protein LOC133292064 n=1 Tax=Gastrolobium bilobum TaxID=150636 RepID=UPI002AB0ECD8|nr:uncharacterized protein LOC133292064 [Gastrolobium bilobum]
MFSPSHLKTLHLLQVFSVKSSSPSSSLSSMKLKRIIHTLIVSHMCRIIRALSKVKAVIVEIFKDNPTIHFPYPSQKKHCNTRKKKIIMGSFRLHYNWCSSKSSHVLPVPEPVYEGLFATHLCHDSTTPEQQGGDDCPESQLAGYLRWLEEKKVQDDNNGANNEKEMNEIDMLAEMFIANCHEKFKLEKQESDRRFQEMLARSM